MPEFEVEVAGAKPPGRGEGKLRRFARKLGALLRAFLKRPALVGLAAVAVFFLAVGTPHVGWDYECRHAQRGGEPCRSAVYCAYYGVQGRRVESPASGETCRLVTLLRIEWARLFGAR